MIAVRTLCALALWVVIPSAKALADFGEPATLIIEAHSENEAGESDPRYTPDAAVHAAIAWARVRHRVTLLTPRRHADTMNAKTNAAARGLPDKLTKPFVESYQGADDMLRLVSAWENKYFFSGNAPRACFGVVHVLGHGETIKGQQVLLLPVDMPSDEGIDNDGLEYEPLVIDDLCGAWRANCTPIAVFLDVCREDHKGQLPAPLAFTKRDRNPIDQTSDVAEFVNVARAQQIPLDGRDYWFTTTAVTAGNNEITVDCPDLLANRVSDGLAIAGVRDKAYFSRFSEHPQKLSVQEAFEFARKFIIRREGKARELTQNGPPDIDYGILTADHVIATSTDQIEYRAPAVPALERWANNLVFKKTENFSTNIDEDTGSVIITRTGKEFFYVHAKASEDFPLDTRFSGRTCAIRVAAKPGTNGAKGKISFAVEFLKDRDFAPRKTFSIDIGTERTVLIDRIPPTEQLALAAIPTYVDPIEMTWPARAELHVLSMEFIDPRDGEELGAKLVKDGSEGNLLHFWYPRDVLASEPSFEVIRTSSGFLPDMEFSFGRLPKGNTLGLAGVGGPLYAMGDVQEGDKFQIRLTSSVERSHRPITVCVLDGTKELLFGSVGNEPLEFKSPGRPEYLAIVVREDSELTVESIEIIARGLKPNAKGASAVAPAGRQK